MMVWYACLFSWCLPLLSVTEEMPDVEVNAETNSVSMNARFAKLHTA